MALSSALSTFARTQQRLSSCNPWILMRCVSSHTKDIQSDQLTLERTKNPMKKPLEADLVFGATMSDHMLTVEWNVEMGWGTPSIKPFAPLALSPSASVLHYGLEVFEGLKAYKGQDGTVRMFRPMENMKRLHNSATRYTLPAFDKEELLKCISELVLVDKDWIPDSKSASLYIRPTIISTEQTLGVKAPSNAMLYVLTGPVGPYFKSGSFNPVSLLADPRFVRAWPGGTGECKSGGNYGPTIFAQRLAEEKGCSQALWLYQDQVTEVGTMNVFVSWINEDGEDELITPPLNGLILPGVTRKSLLELARQWGEFKVTEKTFTMKDLQRALSEQRVKEMFGAGTASVVCPIGRILYDDKFMEIPTMKNEAKLAQRFYNELTDIQYGRKRHEWSLELTEGNTIGHQATI